MFKTLKAAISAARTKAKLVNDELYIIVEAGRYDYANLFDLDTFYCGAQPIATVFPDGEVQY